MFGNLRAAAASAVIAGAALSFAACGGGSGGGANNDSPDGAVRGFIAALQSSNLQSICDWVAPSQKTSCTSTLALVSGFGGQFSVSVSNFDVVSTSINSSDPNKATVSVKGSAKVCVAGSCSSSSLTSGSSGGSVPCVKENGKWYVDFGSTGLLGGGSGASSGSSSTFSIPSIPSLPSSESSSST